MQAEIIVIEKGAVMDKCRVEQQWLQDDEKYRAVRTAAMGEFQKLVVVLRQRRPCE
jgi:hypothetical protein